MAKFKVVSKYKDLGIQLPTRATKKSAGYDLASAEDIVIPSLTSQLNEMYCKDYLITTTSGTKMPPLTKISTGRDFKHRVTLDRVAELIKANRLKPVMIPTGLSIELENDEFLQIQPRSSTGTKYLLTFPSNLGIIDADYIESDNEGHIHLPFINLSPWDIIVHKGDKLAQGIIQQYYVTEDDNVDTKRNGGFGSTNIR